MTVTRRNSQYNNSVFLTLQWVSAIQGFTGKVKQINSNIFLKRVSGTLSRVRTCYAHMMTDAIWQIDCWKAFRDDLDGLCKWYQQEVSICYPNYLGLPCWPQAARSSMPYAFEDSPLQWRIHSWPIFQRWSHNNDLQAEEFPVNVYIIRLRDCSIREKSSSPRQLMAFCNLNQLDCPRKSQNDCIIRMNLECFSTGRKLEKFWWSLKFKSRLFSPLNWPEKTIKLRLNTLPSRRRERLTFQV